jgi:hypothetical protein
LSCGKQLIEMGISIEPAATLLNSNPAALTNHRLGRECFPGSRRASEITYQVGSSG